MWWHSLLIAVLATGCDRRREVQAQTGSGGSAPAVAVARPDARTARRNWSPPPRPSLPAWSDAEAKKTAEAWEQAADAYARQRATCVDDCIDVAYAVVLARKNALGADPIEPPKPEESPPLPPRVKALVTALDEYVALAPPTDPDVLDMKFLAANALNRWNQEDAIGRLEALLRDHRTDPSAEYVANMLLDRLARAERIPELKKWVAELLADPTFLAGKDQLRATLEMLQQRFAQ